jgi:hypothetical protein
VDSVMLHYPPYYGQDKALASLELFATEVIPKFKAAPKRKTARSATRKRPPIGGRSFRPVVSD